MAADKKENGRQNSSIYLDGNICIGNFFPACSMGDSKKELKKKDYYGQYIVDRSFFAGKQADWQYNNFRFEIKENDSIYFFVTNKEQILKTYKGIIATTRPYNSERLIVSLEQPTHHVIRSNPTTYRSAWSFYLVFYSKKFNNIYFKKGQWKPINK
jgi:hypothetical protein